MIGPDDTTHGNTEYNAATRLRERCPDCPQEILERFLHGFPPRYFQSFEPDEQARHLCTLAALSSDRPAEVLTGVQPDGTVTATVLGFDHPGEFSIIAGLLAGSGFEVISGDVYTSSHAAEEEETEEQAPRRHRPGAGIASRAHGSAAGRPVHGGARSSGGTRIGRGGDGRRGDGRVGDGAAATHKPERWIIDHFRGTLRGTYEEWERRFPAQLTETLNILSRGTEEAYEKAKRSVSEAAAAELAELGDVTPGTQERARMEIEQGPENRTRLTVYSKDTPFFLYAFSSALHLHDVSIESVDIRTKEGWVEDIFEITDAKGRPITDERTLHQLRLSAAFTKQFTYFLDRAPDPYRALQRFELLIQDFRALADAGQLGQLLSSPNVLQDLARLLGASDFLWEDFLRLHYEELVPMLSPEHRGSTLSLRPSEIPDALMKALSQGATPEDRHRILNEFKDHHAYLIDVDHILARDTDFFFLSRRLTALAEAVVNQAVAMAWDELTQRHGVPRTVAGIEATYAVMGLGKMGGEALGYASDIELIFLYSDNGTTDGNESVSNREFFDELFHHTVAMIQARREGIFQLDLRLRPHGNAGPLAVSMASFVQYYRSDASSLERLALVRMRRIGGDANLGHRVERVRDELIYGADSIDLQELQRLREVQLREKGDYGRLNAKISPGGLVDLEYSVQILQVMLGRNNPALRTPRIHEALSALVTAGEIDQEESERLVGAYRFLRQLINGLRMLRGNAQDLFLPDVGSLEFMHLARRAGYRGRGNLTPAEELRVEFETRTAEVRAFVEEQLGKEALPGNAAGNIADLVVTEHMEPERYQEILRPVGFRDPERAYRNLKGLAGSGERRYRFAELSILAWDLLLDSPDPDMALNNWEKFVHAAGNGAEHFSELVSQPKRLEILLAIFAGSQFLSDTLIRNPEFFEWATSPETVWQRRSGVDYRHTLQELRGNAADHRDWLNALRRFRKQEILRIGTRDICLNVAIRDVMAELSALAGEIVRQVTVAVFDRLGLAQEARERFCVLAFGKLGARELNYSSDIDLMGVYEPAAGAGEPATREGPAGGAAQRAAGRPDTAAVRADEDAADHGPTPPAGVQDSGAASPSREEDLRQFSAVMKHLRSDLSDHMEEGYVYRVDLRLRPYGSASPVAQTLDAVVGYYASSAAPWEQQALLRLRPLSGTRRVGEELLQRLREPFFATWHETDVREEILKLRQTAVDHHVTSRIGGGTGAGSGALTAGARATGKGPSGGESGRDIKNGVGGLRDIEFLVQGLQILHSRGYPELLLGNTLDAITILEERSIIPEETAGFLTDSYAFLRRVEHFLQMLEDRQVHRLPGDAEALAALGRRIEHAERLDRPFTSVLDEVTGKVRELFSHYVGRE